MERKQRALDLIHGEVRDTYTQYWPIHHIVETTGSLKFAAHVQSGVIIYESRDETYFIMRTSKICDLLRPQQYQYVAGRWSPERISFEPDFYGTEIECRAWVSRRQASLYGFDITQYYALQTKLKRCEEQFAELYRDEPEGSPEHIEIINYLQLIMRAVRLELKLSLEEDQAETTLEEAVSQSEGTRA